ncbi:phage tail assembly chaperone [Sphingopyxis sp. PET50]|uniref:phage tail assembly chaperone n=1 Tax=Sphingopyxis sp. PET50 TaxID=2976533 RepID=UPI0021AFA3E0|nr:phage tail assembly chaperone [Sphingopyxis sp. PET50]
MIGDVALRLAGLMARLAGWAPDMFWASTPTDVAAVLAAWADDAGTAPVDRGALAAMMEVFPDGR